MKHKIKSYNHETIVNNYKERINSIRNWKKLYENSNVLKNRTESIALANIAIEHYNDMIYTYLYGTSPEIKKIEEQHDAVLLVSKSILSNY